MVKSRRKFKFLRQLSEGTFGKVYMAEMIEENNFSRVVAIKLLHGKWLDHEEIVQRSRDEARVLGLINHPGIISVVGFTSIDGKCAIIMEYLDGVDLKSLITYCARHEIDIPVRVCLQIIEQSVAALEAAYYREPLRGGEPLRLIHRDIKPSNIMLTVKREIKVLDFGTAQASFSNREAHTQALAFGSAPYMAPERIMGEEDHPSGDVFSVGVTLFELLTQQRFGKIMYRVEPYEEDLKSRLSYLDECLSKHTLHHQEERNKALRQQLVDLVGHILMYDAPDRPDLQQLLAHCGNLSDEISDGSMRQFCNEVVKACKNSVIAEASIVDDPYVIKDNFIIEDMSDVYTSDMEKVVSAEVTMPIMDDLNSLLGSDISTQKLAFDHKSSNEVTDSSSRTQLLSNEPLSQDYFEEDVVSSYSVSTGIGNAEAPSKAFTDSGVQPATITTRQSTSSSSKVGVILVLGFLFVGLLGVLLLGYGYYSSMLSTPEEAIADIELEKDEPIMDAVIDLGFTEAFGSVTLAFDRGGAAQVTIPIDGEDYEWNGFGSYTIKNIKSGKYKTRFKDTELSKKTMRFEVLEGQNCTYILYSSRDESSWSQASCHPL